MRKNNKKELKKDFKNTNTIRKEKNYEAQNE